MTDHRFILLCFHYFATEDCVAHRFQRVVMIDLGEDVHDSLVVHFRRLEDCIDYRFIRKHNVVGERLLEGSLRGTDGLRAEMQCTRGFVRCSGMFCAREDGVRHCLVRHGGRGHRIHGQYRNYVMV